MVTEKTHPTRWDWVHISSWLPVFYGQGHRTCGRLPPMILQTRFKLEALKSPNEGSTQHDTTAVLMLPCKYKGKEQHCSSKSQPRCQVMGLSYVNMRSLYRFDWICDHFLPLIRIFRLCNLHHFLHRLFTDIFPILFLPALDRL